MGKPERVKPSVTGGRTIMKIGGVWFGIIAIIVGILILVFPDFFRWLVGIGLIVLGIIAFLRK